LYTIIWTVYASSGGRKGLHTLNIGLLEDGSLSKRLKGDLYWKKQNLIFSAMDASSELSRPKTNVLIANLLYKYDNDKDTYKPVLDGNEFRNYPPTASGRDATISGVLRAMKVRDIYRSEGNAPAGIMPVLEETINCFFHSHGYDEATRANISAEEKKNARFAFYSAIKKYSSAVSEILELNAEPDKDYYVKKEDDTNYLDVYISPKRISEFSDYIPENYISQIIDGGLTVTATYIDSETPENFVGTYITGIHEKWVELVWLSTHKKYKEDYERIISFARHIIAESYNAGRYHGIFSEMHIPEELMISTVLKDAGMSVYLENNNNYEFVLSDIVREPSIMSAAEKLSCTPLIAAGDDIKAFLEKSVTNDERMIPVSLPIPWNEYLQEISLIHANEKKNTSGMFLFSKIGDTVVFDLAYTSNAVIMASLIGNAIKIADSIFDPGQKILVPIVSEATRPLIERLVPKAHRDELLEAILWF